MLTEKERVNRWFQDQNRQHQEVTQLVTGRLSVKPTPPPKPNATVKNDQYRLIAIVETEYYSIIVAMCVCN